MSTHGCSVQKLPCSFICSIIYFAIMTMSGRQETPGVTVVLYTPYRGVFSWCITFVRGALHPLEQPLKWFSSTIHGNVYEYRFRCEGLSHTPFQWIKTHAWIMHTYTQALQSTNNVQAVFLSIMPLLLLFMWRALRKALQSCTQNRHLEREQIYACLHKVSLN